MDALSYLITGPMVYLSVGVLVFGMIYRIFRWLSVPASPIRLGIFPKTQGVSRTATVVRDTFLFPQVAEVNRRMWLITVLFHFALLGVFVGHLRLLGRFPGILEAKMSESAHLAGGTMGVILLIGTLYFLFRRFKSPQKELSLPEDYFLLFLLFAIILLGDHLRLFGHIPFEVYREYAYGLLSFRPALPPALMDSPQKIVFVWHVFFANLLFVYLPFSKLVHFAGAVATNGIRRG